MKKYHTKRTYQYQHGKLPATKQDDLAYKEIYRAKHKNYIRKNLLYTEIFIICEILYQDLNISNIKESEMFI